MKQLYAPNNLQFSSSPIFTNLVKFIKVKIVQIFAIVITIKEAVMAFTITRMLDIEFKIIEKICTEASPLGYPSST